VANGKLLKEKIFKNIYIQPASGDAGGALGAALAGHYMYFGKERVSDGENDKMFGTYLGPDYSDKEILLMKKINLKIKYREGFRPFAPSVLAEENSNYFDLDTKSPYMLLVAPIKEERRKVLPDNYYDLPLWKRLYHERSDIQSITHLDFSARVQTVHKEINPRYWGLINEFKNQTGYSIIVNTSFNVRGEPIVMSTEMDYLVINDFVYRKTEQPDWQNKEKWMVKFEMD
jgi:carbamoyltransferase